MEYIYTLIFGVCAIVIGGLMCYIAYKDIKIRFRVALLIAGSAIIFAMLMSVGIHTGDFEQNIRSDVVEIEDKWKDAGEYYFVDTNHNMYLISNSFWRKSMIYENIPVIRSANIKIGKQYKITYIGDHIFYYNKSMMEESCI